MMQATTRTLKRTTPESSTPLNLYLLRAIDQLAIVSWVLVIARILAKLRCSCKIALFMLKRSARYLNSWKLLTLNP